MTQANNPRLAATVILMRQAEQQDFEVFLTRRPDSMPFLGGMYCFPGGTVHRDDGADGMLRQCCGLTPDQARALAGAHFTPRQAQGIWVAAVRELFEETGVLLACTRAGLVPALPSEVGERLSQKHVALTNQEISFQALLESEKLLCDFSTLGYFSCWQTPSAFAVRFDTRFFVARLPEGQTPLATTAEVAHSIWLTPDRALQLFAQGELPMIFPTFASLRTLANYGSLESIASDFILGSKLNNGPANAETE